MLDSTGNFQVSVVIGGTNAEEYTVENIPAHDRQPEMNSCYIASRTGENFSIDIENKGYTRHRQLCIDVRVDGVKCPTRTWFVKNPDEPEWHDSVQGIDTRRDARARRRPFEFSAVKSTDEEAQATSELQTASLGLIEVAVYPGRRLDAQSDSDFSSDTESGSDSDSDYPGPKTAAGTQPKTREYSGQLRERRERPESEPEDDDSQPEDDSESDPEPNESDSDDAPDDEPAIRPVTLYEQRKKTLGLTQQVALGEAVRIRAHSEEFSVVRAGPDLVRFCFRYRCLSFLQAQNHAPAPTPPPPESPSSDIVEVEDPDARKIRELQAELRALEARVSAKKRTKEEQGDAEKSPKKRVKREKARTFVPASSEVIVIDSD
ncbi:hypothetical protein MKEN_00736500 [Mycena kentingensis (nom. inval.)]|nr:hypothetical protein MKEN_00736500 [Mycena kentingensis (nom. inval.)]